MSNLRVRYLRAVGLEDGDDQKVKAAFERVLDFRKAEIELYWKRASYFWAFQLVAFGSLAVLKDVEPKADVILAIGMLGCVTAFVGYLTALGSKFWQENWEAHLDFLEMSFGPRLTQVIVTDGALRFSVSRLNRNLMLAFAFGWLVFFCGGLVQAAWPHWAASAAASISPWRWRIYLIALVVLIVAIVAFSRTNMTGWERRRGWKQWRELGERKVRLGDRLIIRDVVGENQLEPRD